MIIADLDTGFRQGAFDTAVSWYMTQHIAAQVEFIDEGKQPRGIKNVNRPLNLDGVLSYPVGSFSFFGKAGLTSSYWGYNGSGDGYKPSVAFSGVNYGGGVAYKLTDHWAIQGQVVSLIYQQVDKPRYEQFTYGSIGLRYAF